MAIARLHAYQVAVPFLLAALARPLAAQGFVIEDLGAFATGPSSVQALNDHGLVVGYMKDASDNERAVLWKNGAWVILPELASPKSRAYDINAAREIVGWCTDGSFDQRAVIWKGGDPLDLGTLGGTDARAFGMNAAGDAVGWASLTPGGFYHGFIHEGVAMTDGGSLDGSYSELDAINGAGIAVGFAQIGLGVDHAVLWDGAQLHDLEGLPGYSNSAAADVNSAGIVVGYSDMTPSGCCRATMWRNGIAFDLGGPEGPLLRAHAINDQAMVVGEAFGRAACWTKPAGYSDLNDLLPPLSGWVLNEARDVNAFGQVVGLGTKDDEQHGFLLSPLPALTTTDSAAPGAVLKVRLDGVEGQHYCIAIAPDVGRLQVAGAPFLLDLGPDLGAIQTAFSGVIPPGGSAHYHALVPNAPELLGETFYWQAYTSDVAFRKSNRRELVVE
jgi:probable HAF family extracellular repeat protein